MPIIKIELLTAVSQLRNENFMHLYLQLMELKEKYPTITEDKYMKDVFERMQKEVEGVQQLGAKLNAVSDIVKAKNEVHRDIKDTFQHIKGMLKSYQLSHSADERVHADYAYAKLEDLIDQKWMRSIVSTSTVIRMLRRTIEGDVKLANAMKEMSLMHSVEHIYIKEVEFEQLFMQQNKESVKASLINKKNIRKEATKTLKFLFDIIPMNYLHTKDEVWVEMAEEAKMIVNKLKSENEVRL